MPDYLRAFVVVIMVASVTLMVAKPAFSNLVSGKDYNRRVILWLVVTGILFLSNNFWLYLLGSGLTIQLAKPSEKNYVVLYFILLFVAPSIVSVNISGFGIINYLFALNPVRWLELIILLPAAFTLFRRSDSLSFGRTIPDKILIVFLTLTVFLQLRETTSTDTMRFAFYTFIDVFLPYYVFSRALKNMEQFKDAIGALVMASLILAAVAMFEYFWHWLLYSAVVESLNITSNWGGYLMRGDSLRSVGSAGHSLALGFVLMVAIGFYLYLQQFISKHMIRRLLLAILAGGLFASSARGSWIGVLVLVVVYTLLGSNGLKNIIKLTIGGVVAGALVFVLPGGEKIIDLLPFVGVLASDTVSYRQELFEVGMIVIQQHPWLGSVNFRDAPEMQSLIQGQGIIDVVNSYLAITLRDGLAGLGLFVSFFGSILYGVYKSSQRIRFKINHESEYLLGVMLFALLLAILVTIATVSSVLLIPVLYWAVAGMAVGYIQMVSEYTTMDSQ